MLRWEVLWKTLKVISQTEYCDLMTFFLSISKWVDFSVSRTHHGTTRSVWREVETEMWEREGETDRQRDEERDGDRDRETDREWVLGGAWAVDPGIWCLMSHSYWEKSKDKRLADFVEVKGKAAAGVACMPSAWWDRVDCGKYLSWAFWKNIFSVDFVLGPIKRWAAI